MKGRVLGYDPAAEATVIRAEDGKRYRFLPADWREREAPRRGDEVDFEPDRNFAREIFLTAPTAGPAAAGLSSPASMILRHPLARAVFARPVLATALLVLAACLFGAYQIEGAYISIFAAPELISRMAAALDGITSVSGSNAAPRLGAGVARLAMALLLLLYAVPALAGLAAWREFTGRPMPALARLAGFAAMVLPVVLPLLVVLIVRAWVVPGIGEPAARLGRDGLSSPVAAFDVLQLYATGTVLLIASGAALWAAATGRLQLQPAKAVVPKEELNVSQPVERGGPEDFAPLHARAVRHPAEEAGRMAAPPVGQRRGAGAPEPRGADVERSRRPAPLIPSAHRDAAGLSLAASQPDDALARLASEIRAAIGEDEATSAAGAPLQPTAPRLQDLPPRGGSVWPGPEPTTVGGGRLKP